MRLKVECVIVFHVASTPLFERVSHHLLSFLFHPFVAVSFDPFLRVTHARARHTHCHSRKARAVCRRRLFLEYTLRFTSRTPRTRVSSQCGDLVCRRALQGLPGPLLQGILEAELDDASVRRSHGRSSLEQLSLSVCGCRRGRWIMHRFSGCCPGCGPCWYCLSNFPASTPGRKRQSHISRTPRRTCSTSTTRRCSTYHYNFHAAPNATDTSPAVPLLDDPLRQMPNLYEVSEKFVVLVTGSPVQAEALTIHTSSERGERSLSVANSTDDGGSPLFRGDIAVFYFAAGTSCPLVRFFVLLCSCLYLACG